MEKIRCAIYCRKSVEKGLDMEFNSLDAQREAGEAYVANSVSRAMSSTMPWRTLAIQHTFTAGSWLS